MSVTAYIGLGANLGNAHNTLQQALAATAALPDTSLLTVSSMYRSAPLRADGPDYVNAVAKITTSLSAYNLLGRLQGIEQHHGRVRPYPNAPRTLDLDILLYGDETIDDTTLTVPHPRMHERAFVLIPLAELNPDLKLPQGTLDALISRCGDQRIERLPA